MRTSSVCTRRLTCVQWIASTGGPLQVQSKQQHPSGKKSFVVFLVVWYSSTTGPKTVSTLMQGIDKEKHYHYFQMSSKLIFLANSITHPHRFIGNYLQNDITIAVDHRQGSWIFVVIITPATREDLTLNVNMGYQLHSQSAYNVVCFNEEGVSTSENMPSSDQCVSHCSKIV